MIHYLKAPKRRSEYSNTREWLNAVYEHNQEYIDEKLGTNISSPKSSFKENVLQHIREEVNKIKKGNPDIEIGKREMNRIEKRALETVSRSASFTTERERFQDYFWGGITKKTPEEMHKKEKYSESYKTFMNLTRDEHGRFQKFDPEKLHWSSVEKHYVYDNKIIIKFTNSPYSVDIRTIE